MTTGTRRGRRGLPARLASIAATAAAILPAAACALAEGAPEALRIELTEGTNMAASASPDGRTLVLAVQGTLWSVPAGGGEATRLTSWDVEATSPSWSPDGGRIAFQSFSPDGFYHVWTVSADGSDPRQVTTGPHDHREPAWSPDGQRIAFSSDRARSGSYDIWTFDLGTGEYERRTAGSADEHSPAWSPDGARIAYVSDDAVLAVDEEGGPQELARVPSGAIRVPAWLPDGSGVVYQDNARRIVLRGRPVTGDEDVFPFPVSWMPDGSFVYTADGRPRIRDADGGSPRDVAFRAVLEVERPSGSRKDHRLDERGPRPVRGILFPALSPDGGRVAFLAVGDLWVMEIGGRPERLTDDAWAEWSPSWSPDGDRIYFTSERHGDGSPDMYVVDLATREVTRVSVTPDSRMSYPTLSPDGRRFAYIDGGDQSLRVHDIASGSARIVAPQAYASNVGRPAWSPDGRTIALADIERSNTRFREGRNLIRTIDVETGAWRFHEPGPFPDGLSERIEAGPAWSPDGSWMAFVMGSTLHVISVGPDGAPRGEARQLASHAADLPSWGPDSRTILYVSNGRLRTIQADGSGAREIPVDLTWTPVLGEGLTHVRVGGLWNGVTPEIRPDVVIVIRDNRIAEVRPAGADPEAQARAAGARFVDAPELTAMPGLWDAHVHPRMVDYTSQWWAVQLAYGFTTVLSNGASTYHSLLAREAISAGRWVAPRILIAPIFDGPRTFYGHHRVIRDQEVLGLELAKARELEMDYIKAYVRAPAISMWRIANVAREMGVPNGSHFLSPGIQTGMGGTTHLQATQRMGYGWAQSVGGRNYQDVMALYTAGDFHLSSHHTANNVLGDDPAFVEDPRFLKLMPPNYMGAIVAQASSRPGEAQRQAVRDDVSAPAEILRAGGLVTLGSDTPLRWPAVGLHAQLRAFAHGVSNHEALQAATIHAARYAYLDHELGTVEPGKVADLILVRGDPLEDVANAARVEVVVKDGIVITVEDILRPYR